MKKKEIDNMAKIKSIELGLIDNDNIAVNLNIPIKSIYMLNISGITSSIGYADGENKEIDELLSFRELDLKLYSTKSKDIILNNPFIICLIIYLDDNTKIFYDVPYQPDNESGTNILQEVTEEVFDDKDIIRLKITDR